MALAQTNRAPIRLDMTGGRNGDGWMRLVALWIAAGFDGAPEIVCAPVPSLRSLAERVFGDRLRIVEQLDSPTYIFMHRGLRTTIPAMIRGKRVVVPYPRVIAHVRGVRSVKQGVTLAALSCASAIGWAGIPPRRNLARYYGFIDLSAIPRFGAVPWPEFRDRLISEAPELSRRLHASGAGILPDSRRKLLVFPSGSVEGAMPASFAAERLRRGTFAFYRDDPRRSSYEAAGLPTVVFSTPEEILALARSADCCVSTDSFPSHLIQYLTSRAVLCLAHDAASRVVSPSFDGRVIHSAAPCCPCIGPNPTTDLCARGLPQCVTWAESSYGDALCDAIEEIDRG